MEVWIFMSSDGIHHYNYHSFTGSQNSWSQHRPLVDIWPNLYGSNTQSRLARTLPRWLLNIMWEGNSTSILGNLCQFSVIFSVKTCSLMFRGNIRFSFCSSLLMLSLGTTEKSLALFFLHPFLNYKLPLNPLLQVEQVQISQPITGLSTLGLVSWAKNKGEGSLQPAGSP